MNRGVNRGVGETKPNQVTDLGLFSGYGSPVKTRVRHRRPRGWPCGPVERPPLKENRRSPARPPRRVVPLPPPALYL